MNNGTFNKKLSVKETLKPALGVKKLESKTLKDRDELETSHRSPIIYNKYKLNTINAKKFINSDKKLVCKEKEILSKKEDLKIETVDPIICKSDREKLKKLETDMKLIKSKLSDQEKMINSQKSRIKELEEANSKLIDENIKVSENYEKVKNELKNVQRGSNQNIDHEEENIGSANNYQGLNRLGRIAEMINNMREFIYADNDVEYDQMYPNPDNMTYEELLELQEKIGFVNRGLSPEEIDKVPTVIFSKSNTYTKNCFDTCTICQLEFQEDEILKQLTCEHCYHVPCIDQWFGDNKLCPICKEEVKIYH